MISFFRIFWNSSLIFAISIMLGLIFPGPAHSSQALITPALMLMMAFSTSEIELEAGPGINGALAGFAMNYLLLSGLILAMAFTLEDEILYQGFVVMAAVPPAVAVIPLTRLLDGDSKLSLYSEALCYLVSPVLMPALILAFAGRSGVDVLSIFETAILLIVLPFIISRYLRRFDLDPVPPINLSFFLVTYIVVGLNSEVIIEGLKSVALIAALRTFGIGTATYIACGLICADAKKRVSMTLLSSFKNLGLAAAVSLMLFGPRAAVPSAVCILAETGFYIIFSAAKNLTSKHRAINLANLK